MPNLFELKSLENLKYIHKQYIKAIHKYSHRQYWRKFPCPVCHTVTSTDKLAIDGLHYVTCTRCKAIYNSPQLVVPLDNLYDTYRDRLVKPSNKLRQALSLRKYFQI